MIFFTGESVKQEIYQSENTKKVIEEYGLNHYGVWEIKGGCQNFGYSGIHIKPHLGYFEGTLAQTIRKASMLKDFKVRDTVSDCTAIGQILPIHIEKL